MADPFKAKEKLGSTPEITPSEMSSAMDALYLDGAEFHALLKERGLNVVIFLKTNSKLTLSLLTLSRHNF
ncbi:MAG: hypothetical protein HRU20_05420 [Pseudomonadales bacterium]|nr:hypothetical protein [Pseudomonadales bacterium]